MYVVIFKDVIFKSGFILIYFFLKYSTLYDK